MEIVWQDPPEHVVAAQRRTPYRDFAKALRENPGKWALLPAEKKTAESAKNTALNLRNGRMAGFGDKGEFEAVVDDKKVYVRYIGKTETQAAEQVAERSEQPAPTVPRQQPQQAEDDRDDARVVREWALRHGGFHVPERGRLSNEVHRAYQQWRRDQGL